MPTLTPEQIAERKTFIGGSMVAAILGLSPWQSPREAYDWYLGLLPDKPQTPAMAYGHYVEEAIAKFYQESTGRLVWEDPATYKSLEFLHMGCHVDRFQLVGQAKGVAEIKHTSMPLTDDLLKQYRVQLYHNMVCTGVQQGTVVVSAGGRAPVWFDEPYDTNVAESIIRAESMFWTAVQTRDYTVYELFLKETQPMALRDLSIAGTDRIGPRRLQIIGAPNTFKTSTVLTMDHPLCLVGLPGEKHTEIIQPHAERKVLVFDPPDFSSSTVDWVKQWDEVKAESRKVLNQTYGKFKTVVFDGTHKAYEVCRRAAMQKYKSNGGEGWDGRKGWPWIADEFLGWFSMGYYADAEWVIWIAWSTAEKDDPLAEDGTVAGAKKSIWPDYMGKFQRTAMGETNIIYQFVEGGRAYWQIRADEKIKGIGLRVSPDLAVKLPVKVEAQWPKLKAILQPEGGAK